MGNLKALGSNTSYGDKFDPSLLESFSRSQRREGFVAPMNGADIWTAFEVSFLYQTGLPCAMVLRILTYSDSPNIFESKSLKLFLNSLNNTRFESKDKVLSLIRHHLSVVAGEYVEVEEVVKFGKNPLYDNSRKLEDYVRNFSIFEYSYNPGLLKTKPKNTDRQTLIELHTDLGRSNCEITNQPDWFRLYVKYEPGEVEVSYESLLLYIVSLRTHQMFHEPTVETIYNDLFKVLKPKRLLVLGQFTRRGGIDINPCRYTHKNLLPIDLICLPKLIQQ